jgi:hypothetical protein
MSRLPLLLFHLYASLAAWSLNSLVTLDLANIDPSLVPESLRQHILPAIRKVYLEQPTSTDPPDQFALLKSENDTLNVLCNMWRGRSEAHAAATVGLLNMARTMKDQFIQMKTERDELEKQYNMLKSKVEEPE